MNLSNIISDIMDGISSPIIKLPNGLFVTCTKIMPNQDGLNQAVDLYYGAAEINSFISIIGYPTKWKFDVNTGKWYQNVSTDSIPLTPGIIDIGGGVR